MLDNIVLVRKAGPGECVCAFSDSRERSDLKCTSVGDGDKTSRCHVVSLSGVTENTYTPHDLFLCLCVNTLLGRAVHEDFFDLIFLDQVPLIQPHVHVGK